MAAAIRMVKVPPDDLQRFSKAALAAMGLKDEDAAITADALIYSELRFHPGQGAGGAPAARLPGKDRRGQDRYPCTL